LSPDKIPDAFSADFFADTCVKDVDCVFADRASKDPEAIPISARFISEPAQKFGALGRQGECNRNPCHVERRETPSYFESSQFFSLNAGLRSDSQIIPRY
jgi:hypothetical protein